MNEENANKITPKMIVDSITYILYLVVRDFLCFIVVAYALSICFGYPFELKQAAGIMLIDYLVQFASNHKTK